MEGGGEERIDFDWLVRERPLERVPFMGFQPSIQHESGTQ